MNLMVPCCYSSRKWCKQHLSISTTVLRISSALRWWIFWTLVALLKHFCDSRLKTNDLMSMQNGFFVSLVFHSKLQCQNKQQNWIVQPLFHSEEYTPQVIPRDWTLFVILLLLVIAWITVLLLLMYSQCWVFLFLPELILKCNFSNFQRFSVIW